MAEYLPIRAISRSQQVRIGGQKISPTVTTFVDISDGKTRRDLQNHSAIGAIIVVGELVSPAGTVHVIWGAQTNEGAANNDMVIRTLAGQLINQDTGVVVNIAQTDTTLSTADVTNPRIDIQQVHTGTGVVSKKSGTAAASPTAPLPDASNATIASILVPANDTAITNNQITDLRP